MNFDYFKRTWNGEEKLKILFWIYYVIGSIGIAMVPGVFQSAGLLIGINYGAIFSLIIVVPYFVWIMVSLWRCAFNVDKRIWGYIVRGIVVFTIVSYLFRLIYA